MTGGKSHPWDTLESHDTYLIVKHVPCHVPTHKPTQKRTPPHGLKRLPTHLPLCSFDCQYMMVPDLDESESWATVNKHRECREGTERLRSVGGTV